MKRELKSIVPDKDIIVLDIEINDDVINTLRVMMTLMSNLILSFAPMLHI